MINKSKWIYNYKNLNPDHQIEVANAIVNELKDNEFAFDEYEYNKEISKKIREAFNLIKNSRNRLDDLKKWESILERYKNLSQDNKGMLSYEVYNIIEKYINKQEQEDKEKICHNEGHIFGQWKHNKWTKYIDIVIDHQCVKNYPVGQENWQRKCTRCGLIDEVKQEPQELIDARKEKNKQARIKRLERTLKRLREE